MENDPKVLVSTDWLSSRLSDPEIRILDATWYLPNVDRDAKLNMISRIFPMLDFRYRRCFRSSFRSTSYGATS